MTANELAEAMETRASIRRQATSRKSVQENANDRLAEQLEQAATMLRQQQAEIEALKKDLLKYDKLAWDDLNSKTLTDEEIKEIAAQHIEKRLDGDRFGYFEFARAILRKAQE